MKILLSHEGNSYLVDLSKLKPKGTRDLIIEAGDDELLAADTSSFKSLDLDALISQALRPVSESRTTRATSPAKKQATPSYRAWYNGLTGDAKAKADAHDKENKGLNEHGPYPDWLKKAYAEAHP